MINFFTIVLLGLLILLKVILVTSLFKNIEISRSDKHFKTKTIIKEVPVKEKKEKEEEIDW